VSGVRGKYRKPPIIPGDTFAQRFRYLYERSGKTQHQLAAEIGVSQRAIADWIYCETIPRLDMAVWCAQYFGVTVGQMAGVEPLVLRD
jgi:transcriptional regulator with XRE-family HTH domain